MTATLQHSNRRVRHYKADAAIGTLLAQLGLDYNTANFWTENSFILGEILHDAFVVYRERIVRVAPRQSGDDEDEASELNTLWAEIKRRFHQHMHPQLTPKASGQRKAHPYNGGKFLRHCLYDKCGQQFFTENNRKVYCCELHKTLQGHKNITRRQHAQKVIVHRRCAYRPCGVRFAVTVDSKKKFHTRLCNHYWHTTDWMKRKRKGITG